MSENKNKTIIIIPSRLASVRLPRKPLIEIDGIPMIIRVYREALSANIGNVVVAGCDTDMKDLLDSYGYNYVDTDPNLQSGTDRVFAAYKALGKQYDNIINLQSDMPHVNPATIIAVNNILNDENEPTVDISTAATSIVDAKLIDDPNVVKVIITHKNTALYFTRSPILLNKIYKHMGIYGFKEAALKKFVSQSPSELEKQEKLEQLRALEDGMKIKVAIVDDPNISIDAEKDLLMSHSYLKSHAKD
jgi:3-deoxy-manno-octulosonate cytidylyltransferase (CMP-KDO synthetase)